MTIGEMIALGALLVSLVSAVVAIRKSSRSGAAAQARTEAILERLVKTVEEIRVDQRALCARTDALMERLAAVEQSAKSAHHRLDDWEKIWMNEGHKAQGRG